MYAALTDGFHASGTLPGTLQLDRRAPELLKKYDHQESNKQYLLMAAAYAVTEVNAAGGRIVTAPTCGACGVLPAVLEYGEVVFGYPHTQIIKAIAIAGLMGMIIKTNASISGAEAGCQAEVGSACSMSAAA
jgi:L-serine dehydratase